MRRIKTGRQPRGVLLVPVLKEPLSEESEAAPVATDDEPTEETPTEKAMEQHQPADAEGSPAPPSAPPPAAPHPAITPPPAAPPPVVPIIASGGPSGGASDTLRRVGRPAAFVALLVALAFAGLMVGRLLRGSDDGTPAARPSSSTTSAVRTTSTPTPKPTFETWGPLHATPAGALARPAARAAATLAGAQVVVLGGSSGNAIQLGKPGAKLHAVGSLPSRRAGAAAFVDGGSVYLIGGEDSAALPTDEIARVDLASHAVTSAGTFVEPLAGAGYVQSGKSLLLVGGWTGDKYATAVLRFTLPGSVAVVARLPEATRDAAVAMRGNTLYVAGGRTESGLSNAVYAVDVAAGTVSVVGRLPHAVAGASLVKVGSKLYLFGGKDASGPVKTVVRIDPATGAIEPAGTMPHAFAGAATVEAGGATYLLGGTRPTSVFRLETG
jgi:hypothetical protein